MRNASAAPDVSSLQGCGLMLSLIHVYCVALDNLEILTAIFLLKKEEGYNQTHLKTEI